MNYPAAAPQINVLQQIAAQLLGQIDWTTPTEGFCRCPGIDLHTHKNARTDCRVHIERAPNVYCHHHSCSGARKAMNYNLQSAIGRAERDAAPGPIKPYVPTEADRARRAKVEADAALHRRAAATLPVILRDFALDPADLWESSPVRLMDAPDNDWRLLLSLFVSDDWLWIGQTTDSGQPDHAFHFRPVSEWLDLDKSPGPFTNPCAFKPDSFSRCNANVVARRFFVLESDTLSKADSCAVFQWTQQFIRLRAVVDTGGKSLHGWFDPPSPETEAELRTILPELGIDDAVFKLSQPVRLPGYPRVDKGTKQALLFFDP